MHYLLLCLIYIGLIIDIKRGNFLKVDRHKYVRKAYHGLDELTAGERKSVYSKEVTTFTDSNYVNIDTLFLLIDALLFAHLVTTFVITNVILQTVE